MGRESDFTQQPNNLQSAETLQSAFVYNQWVNFSRKQSFIVIITIFYTYFFLVLKNKRNIRNSNKLSSHCKGLTQILRKAGWKEWRSLWWWKIPIAAICIFFSLTKEPILYVFFGCRFMFQYVQRISLFKRSIYCNFFLAFAAQMGRKNT